MATNSYVFRVLAFLSASPRPRSTSEIRLELANWANGRPNRFIPESLDGLNEAMQSLETIGAVYGVQGQAPEELGWAFAGIRKERGGNDGGGGNDGNATPPDDNGGGKGLSEVLSHPVLFCLPEQDQDTLLSSALGLLPDTGVA